MKNLSLLNKLHNVSFYLLSISLVMIFGFLAIADFTNNNLFVKLCAYDFIALALFVMLYSYLTNYIDKVEYLNKIS